MRGPETCVEASTLVEQIEGLLGRPLASVEGVDFEVEIAADPQQSWRLRVDTIERAEQRKRTRELTGRSCAELADAAAVAIAMSVKASTERNDAPPKSPAPAPERAPSPTPKPVVSAPMAAAAPPPLRGAVALTVLADAGALPHAGLGLSLEGSLQFRRLRVVGIGALFPSQQTLLPGSTTGGDFQLAVGGVMACLTQGLDRWTVLVCGGAEIGRLSAEGVGVNNPKLGAALWAAGRGDAGAVLSLGPRLALLLRGGVALPVTRPTFVLDGETPVHRPSSVTARATLGVEMLF